MAAGSHRRIYLVRHGETLYGGASEGAFPGGDLTDQGYRQIEALATLLAGIPLDAIYTSPLGRAQATAATIAKKNGAPVTVHNELVEIMPGDVMGKDMAQIFAAVRGFFANVDTGWDTAYLGGETYRGLRERVWPFVEALAARSDWQRVAIVAHGGVNNAIIGQVLGVEAPRLCNIDQDFGCVNVIDLVGDRPTLRLLNFTAYDPLKAELEAPSIEILRRLLEAGLQVTIGEPES